jgi:hypothetical protein
MHARFLMEKRQGRVRLGVGLRIILKWNLKCANES